MRQAIGCDIVDIARFERSLERGGDRFLARLFTPHERGLAGDRAGDPAYWAVRFAAKEACAKALGTGLWRSGIRWHEIEIIKRASGQPELVLRGQAEAHFLAGRWQGSSVSLSHDRFALATVLLWGQDED